MEEPELPPAAPAVDEPEPEPDPEVPVAVDKEVVRPEAPVPLA